MEESSNPVPDEVDQPSKIPAVDPAPKSNESDKILQRITDFNMELSDLFINSYSGNPNNYNLPYDSYYDMMLALDKIKDSLASIPDIDEIVSTLQRIKENSDKELGEITTEIENLVESINRKIPQIDLGYIDTVNTLRSNSLVSRFSKLSNSSTSIDSSGIRPTNKVPLCSAVYADNLLKGYK